MKKILIISISLSLIFLLGCSNERIKTNSEENIDNTISKQEVGNYKPEENIDNTISKQEVDNYESKENTDSTISVQEIGNYEPEENIDNTVSTQEVVNYEYEELSKLSEKIDIQNYNMNIETDNVGKRIIIFEKNGKKMYKSIFIKSKRLLKFIDLQNEEKLLINEGI